MGIFTAWGTIGYAAGPFISAFLTENFGLKSTIWVMIPGLIAAYLLYVLLPKAPLHGKPPVFIDVKNMIFSLKKILFILIFISIIRAVVIYSFHVYMPFVWQKTHYSILTIGTAIAAFSFCGGIASFIGGHLSNYIGRKNIMICSLLPAIPCLIGTLVFLKTIPMLAFGLFVLSGFLLMSSTSVNMVIAQKAAPENKGLLSGLTGGLCWGIAGIIQTPIGFMANSFGIENILLVLAFLPILGAIAAFFIPKEYA
jgi:FSR family fosmidomycin resistance protein-like MFS transporter